MEHFQSLEGVHLQSVWLTIGSFDGVHRGHQEIARRLTAGAHADGSLAVVLTFFPHPAVVLGRRDNPFYLTLPEERAALLGELGVDIVITYPFDRQVAATSARDFLLNLKAHLGLRRLLVGKDFALGRNREGDVPMLSRLGSELDYTLTVIPQVINGQAVISSSQIRTALMGGEVEGATSLLGRPYRLGGKVIPGDGRGRTIGIPTANLEVWVERTIPKPGVYVCRAQVRGEKWKAVTNIGVRPTFENQPSHPMVETHLLDFEGDLYNEVVFLDFISRLRDEQRFPSVQALVAQIHADIERARGILEPA